MKIAIFDDEQFYLDNTKKIISSFFSNIDTNIYTFNTNVSLSEHIIQNPDMFDIIIMDIEMPKINGIKLAEYIRKYNKRVRLIFLTNYINYAPDVYDTDHTFFVLKSNAESRLPVALDKAVVQLKKIHSKTIAVDTIHSGKVILDIDDILYLERIMRETVIYTTNGQERTSVKLDKIVKSTSVTTFEPIHRSYIVNMRHIKRLTGNDLQMSDGTTLHITRNYSKQFKEAFLRYIKNPLIDYSESEHNK